MKLNKKKIILPASFIAAILIVGVSFADTPGGPCQDHTLLGWGWSENVGAVSFSCKNQGTASDYGVDIAAGGKLSGHAWNENIGTISFDRPETNIPPSNDPCSADGSCTAQLQGDKIVGWARAISACNWDGTKCTDSGAGSNAGGWDGWIRFDLPGSTTTISSIKIASGVYAGRYPLFGWASSGKDTAAESGVIGPISMNDANPNTGGDAGFYKVASLVGPNRIPTADFECDNSGCNYVPAGSCACYNEEGSVLAFNNLSTDPDGPSDIEFSRWYKVGPGRSSPFPSSWTNEFPGISQYSMSRETPGEYKLRLIVVDKKGDESLPKDEMTIEFLKGLKADFECKTEKTDWSANCGNISVEEGKAIWLKDTSSASESLSGADGSINGRTWKDKAGTVFGNGGGIATTTASMNTSEITLEVTDSNGHAGSAKKSLKVIPLPRWRELLPF